MGSKVRGVFEPIEGSTQEALDILGRLSTAVFEPVDPSGTLRTLQDSGFSLDELAHLSLAENPDQVRSWIQGTSPPRRQERYIASAGYSVLTLLRVFGDVPRVVEIMREDRPELGEQSFITHSAQDLRAVTKQVSNIAIDEYDRLAAT